MSATNFATGNQMQVKMKGRAR